MLNYVSVSEAETLRARVDESPPTREVSILVVSPATVLTELTSNPVYV